jgi:dihydrolipoamide dehydrogenase
MSGVLARIAGIAIPDSALAVHARLRGVQRLSHPAQRRRAADRRHALGPEAGEWLQQATLAIRARVPLDILRDTIQPFPTFSEIYLGALKALHGEIATAQPVAEVAS